MEKCRKMSGITLVSVMITVIVLLIIAGVSMQAIYNGLINEAKRSKNTYEVTKEKEKNDIHESLNMVNIHNANQKPEIKPKPEEPEGLPEIKPEEESINVDELLGQTLPKGTIYETTIISDKTILEEQFGGVWEKIAEGKTIVGVGDNTEKSYSIDMKGGNSETNNISIEHNHEYYKLYPHTHTYGYRIAGFYGTTTEYNHYIYNNGQWKSEYITDENQESLTTDENSASSHSTFSSIYLYEQTAQTRNNRGS